MRHFTQGRSPFLVRLACVRHAASVDSEPGSNSRLNTGCTYSSTEVESIGAPMNLESSIGLKQVRMTRPKSVHVSRLARSTMLSKIRDGHRVGGPLLDQGRLQCCRLCPRTCMGCIRMRTATCSLLSGLSAQNRVAFTLYCVAPTNSEYRVCASVSTGLLFALRYRLAILLVAVAPGARWKAMADRDDQQPRRRSVKLRLIVAGTAEQHHKLEINVRSTRK